MDIFERKVLTEENSGGDLAVWFDKVGIQYHKVETPYSNGYVCREYVIDALPHGWMFAVIHNEFYQGGIRFIVRQTRDFEFQPMLLAVAEYDPKDGTLTVYDRSCWEG